MAKTKPKSKGKPARNPLARPGSGQNLDPAVAATLQHEAIKQGETVKLTLRGVPVDLVLRIKQIASNEVGVGKDRQSGVSDVAVALLEEGLDAFDHGRLKLARGQKIIPGRIVREGKK